MRIGDLNLYMQSVWKLFFPHCDKALLSARGEALPDRNTCSNVNYLNRQIRLWECQPSQVQKIVIPGASPGPPHPVGLRVSGWQLVR